MATLATSFMTGRERNCTYSIVLDKRSNRTRTNEFPLSVRFTIDKKSIYLPIGGSYTPQYFSDVTNAKKSRSAKYTDQQQWAVIIEKYKTILSGLNRGHDLTLEQIKTSISGKSDNDEISFIGIWEQIIERLNKEGRFTTAESYTCALRSFSKILWNTPVIGFKINSETLQKWSDGMRNGVENKNGKIVGKIADATRGIYLRTARVVWNECVRLGYLSNAEYPFSNRKALGLVNIPKGATRKDRFLNVEQMTELYYIFRDHKYPDAWGKVYTEKAHQSLGLFLVQYLCNGFNLADAAQLTYNNFYFQSQGKAFLFNRKKTAGRSENGAEVIIPIIEPLRYILHDIAATPEMDKAVFPWILNGATDEKTVRRLTSQENSNVKDRVIRICDECLHWDIRPSGTWCRHSFATNLRNAGVEMNYISESMGHSMPDHSVTELYIEHYPLAKQMEYNSLLLDIKSNTEQRKQKILNCLSTLSLEELEEIMRERQARLKAALSFRDRNCTFSLTLDKRTNRKNPENYPLSVRFTIDRKSIYHHVGREYSQAEYEQIRDAKAGDAHYEERRHWGELMDQYELLIKETVKGHALTLDVIKSRLNIKSD